MDYMVFEWKLFRYSLFFIILFFFFFSFSFFFFLLLLLLLLHPHYLEYHILVNCSFVTFRTTKWYRSSVQMSRKEVNAANFGVTSPLPLTRSTTKLLLDLHCIHYCCYPTRIIKNNRFLAPTNYSTARPAQKTERLRLWN